jgi:chromosome segregation ATPase
LGPILEQGLEDQLQETNNELASLLSELNHSIPERRRQWEEKTFPNKHKWQMLATQFESIEAQLKRAQENMRKLSSQQKQLSHLKEAIARKRADDLVHLQRLVEILREEEANAVSVSPERMSSNRSVAQLSLAIDKLETRLREQQHPSQQQRRAQIIAAYKKAKRKYAKLSKGAEKLDRLFQVSTQNLSKKMDKYNHYRSEISRRFRLIFNTVLSKWNCAGSLQFDHNNKAIDIRGNRKLEEKFSSNSSSSNSNSGIQQESDVRPMKFLSGGERSVFALAFLIALLDSMEFPFCALDEFDLSMDEVHRYTSIQLLLGTACVSKDHQFIFITAHDISPKCINEFAEVRIHRLGAGPERDQASAPLQQMITGE